MIKIKKEKENYNRKMDKGYEQTIHRKEVQIANKHMNQGNANSSKKRFFCHRLDQP